MSLLFFLSHCKCLVLAGFHNLAFALALVVDAAKVQNTVDDYAVQLLLICRPHHFAVAAHGVERDEKVAADDIILAVVEGDDVGVIVMLQVLAVYLKNLLVVAEYVGNVANLLSV